MNAQTIALLLNLGIVLVILSLAFRKLKTPGAVSLIVLCLFIGLWTFCYLEYRNPVSVVPGSFLIAAAYLSATIAASAEFTFSLSYTNRSPWISRFTIILLSAMPILTQILFWTGARRDIFFGSPGVPSTDLMLFTGLWGKINAIYVYNL